MKNIKLFIAILISTSIACEVNAQLKVTTGGNVGIGTTSPTSVLHTIATGAKTAAYTGNLLTNTATSSTASITKSGLEVKSTGTWNGTSASNIGLYVSSVTGGANNYDAIFNGGGNVGIGTTSPGEKLAVAGHIHLTGTRSEIYGTDRNHMIILRGRQDGTTADETSYYQYGDHVFYTNGAVISQTEKMRIKAGGNVGIGTTSPGYKLEVDGAVSSKGGKLYAARNLTDLSTRRNWGFVTESNYAGDLTINESNANNTEPSQTRFCILSGGNVGINWTNPSYKLHVNGTAFCTNGAWESDSINKKNIQNLPIEGISIIKKLRPVAYEWKNAIDPGMMGTEMGFVAQEIEKILPTMVITSVDSLGGPRKAVKFLELLPVIIKGMQEQQTIIDSLLALPSAKKAVNNDSLMREIETLKALVNQCCTAPSNQNSTGENSKGSIQVELANKNEVVLYQNEPNPFSFQTVIRYFVPENMNTAFIIFHDEFGKEVKKVEIVEKGFGKIEANTENLASGIYTYSIVVDGNIADTKKMLRSK